MTTRSKRTLRAKLSYNGNKKYNISVKSEHWFFNTILRDIEKSRAVIIYLDLLKGDN